MGREHQSKHGLSLPNPFIHFHSDKPVKCLRFLTPGTFPNGPPSAKLVDSRTRRWGSARRYPETKEGPVFVALAVAGRSCFSGFCGCQRTALDERPHSPATTIYSIPMVAPGRVPNR
jgi:hypothetical protein